MDDFKILIVLLLGIITAIIIFIMINVFVKKSISIAWEMTKSAIKWEAITSVGLINIIGVAFLFLIAITVSAVDFLMGIVLIIFQGTVIESDVSSIFVILFVLYTLGSLLITYFLEKNRPTKIIKKMLDKE